MKGMVHSCQCVADAYPCDVVGEDFPGIGGSHDADRAGDDTQAH